MFVFFVCHNKSFTDGAQYTVRLPYVILNTTLYTFHQKLIRLNVEQCHYGTYNVGSSIHKSMR